MFNQQPSQDNEHLLAAVTYFPFISLFLIFTSWKKNQYFLRYHSGHAIVIYSLSMIILIVYILLFMLLSRIITDSFYLNIFWGLFFSVHMLLNFIFIFYCSVQAYTGKYIVVPVITKIHYLLFNR